MSRIDLFRQLVGEGRDFLEATVSDVTQAQSVWAPPGRALPIAAQYAHVVAAQDFGLGMLRGTVPLALGVRGDRTGMAVLPPAFGHPWDEWGRQHFQFATLREYARDVYVASDDYFAQLDEAEWSRPIDLTAARLWLAGCRVHAHQRLGHEREPALRGDLVPQGPPGREGVSGVTRRRGPHRPPAPQSSGDCPVK